ncbi:hypothetical protein BH11GEM1_BH11GEM1_23460 [soil metagenome]
MHRTSILSSVIVAVALVAACTSNKPATSARPERMLGTWRFFEQVSQDLVLEGQFTVEQDTIDVDIRPGPCRYERDRSNMLAITYSCGPEVSFSFDRSDPVRRARYSALVHLTEQRTVCRRYAADSAGRRVCVETGQETVFRDARRSGILRVERVVGEP